MIEISLIRDLVAIFGVIAGFSYYVLTVKATRRNQEQQLETRQAQLYMQIFNRFASEEGTNRALEILESEWKDYEDFNNKYGSDNNREWASKRNHVFMEHDAIGYLLHRGLLDIDMVYQINGYATKLVWDHFKSIIQEQRKQLDWPDWMRWFEYLANRIDEYEKQQTQFKT